MVLLALQPALKRALFWNSQFKHVPVAQGWVKQKLISNSNEFKVWLKGRLVFMKLLHFSNRTVTGSVIGSLDAINLDGPVSKNNFSFKREIQSKQEGVVIRENEMRPAFEVQLMSFGFSWKCIGLTLTHFWRLLFEEAYPSRSEEVEIS